MTVYLEVVSAAMLRSEHLREIVAPMLDIAAEQPQS
jgi:hypothetical protein